MPYFYGIDITYFIFIIPALIFGLWAQISVKSAFSKYSRVSTARGITGAEAAKLILEQNGIYDVTIRHISGSLTDNFNPREKTINLSDEVYNSTSVAAIGVAARTRHSARGGLQPHKNPRSDYSGDSGGLLDVFPHYFTRTCVFLSDPAECGHTPFRNHRTFPACDPAGGV